MPKPFLEYLDGDNIYTCINCGTHLATLDNLISKNFTSSQGPAYLFNSVINIAYGQLYETRMRSGIYTVRDIYCFGCESDQDIGWLYVSASDAEQKYKEGRFVVSEQALGKECWTGE